MIRPQHQRNLYGIATSDLIKQNEHETSYIEYSASM